MNEEEVGEVRNQEREEVVGSVSKSVVGQPHVGHGFGITLVTLKFFFFFLIVSN